MAATCTFPFMPVSPAGFQTAEVASLTVPTTAPDMPMGLPPTPIERNSLLYFGAWAKMVYEMNKRSRVRNVFLNIIGQFG